MPTRRLIESFNSSGELLALGLNQSGKIDNAGRLMPFARESLKSLKEGNQILKVFLV